MAKSSGGGGRATSVRAFAERLGFAVSSYRGSTRLTRGGSYRVFKDNDKLTSFLGQTFYREVQLGRPQKRL